MELKVLAMRGTKRAVLAMVLLSGLLGGAAPMAVQAATIDTEARQAILMDADTGTVLFAKNADQHMPTSSMSKVMTMYMVFDRLKNGKLSLEDTLPVSRRAWELGGAKTEGSTMYLPLGASVKVEDLIRGVLVQSGNDATIVLAEGLGGTEEAFCRNMTKRAHDMGMKDSNFTNAAGLPDANHYSTAHDLAILAIHTIHDFPEYYHYFSELEFTYNKIKQGNRNPLLYRNMGVDGLKTGHTEAGGYGLIASAKRGDRRLVLVINGLTSMQSRADEPARLLEWGFHEFDDYALFKAGDTVDTLPVSLGTADTVPVVIPEALKITLTNEQRRAMKVSVVTQLPLAAPVAKGATVATLKVTAPDLQTVEIPLQAANDVPRLGLFGRMGAGLHRMIFGS
ncbi:D-alanyl-D-alanine carboxypeptidase family protein [Nitrospirillum sp. BR 11828]|uniref:D-alanyl-D-alanine carboxypeptidase family protein n=1 Tax=Nitrospirillum sp. BR 11828 TaxID=3104325 RepID=UPI002ACA0D19|nr:D-alanyl-D-alanine carboxypeptidase family protein [Nitrospirillum sp. BR 11828]MDZ5648443.1 D-alanyl-D-alanine carboxypeptidase family protein [Nitrospirillum sp. BR 11828]